MAESEVIFRTPYNYDRDLVSDQAGLSCEGDPGVTKQSFRDECDINVIFKRFQDTGIPPGGFHMPAQEDFTDLCVDFTTAQNMMAAAKAEFMRMPADMRARWHNDPGELVAWLHDSANAEEADRLGFLRPGWNAIPEASPPKGGGGRAEPDTATPA